MDSANWSDGTTLSIERQTYNEETTDVNFLPWDNADNVISLDTQFTVTKILCVFTTTGAILGLALNITNCVVYARLGLRDRINFLLFSQSLADWAVCICMALYSLEYSYSLIFLGGNIRPHCPIQTAVSNKGVAPLYGFSYVSGFVSTLIATDRCLCVTLPLRARRMLKTSSTAAVVLCTAIVFITLHYFIGDKYRLRCEFVASLHHTVPVYYASEFYEEHSRFVDALNVVAFGVSLPLLFVTTTALTTTITAVKLRTAARWRHGTASVAMETKEAAVTRMLVAVSCVFVACSLPNILIRTTPLFVPEFRIGGRQQNVLILCVTALYVFNTVNSAVNFVFYYRMGTKFRAMLSSSCGRRSHHGNRNNHTLPTVA